jgi:hypothetical protein
LWDCRIAYKSMQLPFSTKILEAASHVSKKEAESLPDEDKLSCSTNNRTLSDPCDPANLGKRICEAISGSKRPFPRVQLKGYKLCITNPVFLGQVPKRFQVGDDIAILFGTQAPFVIRRDLDHFLLVGDCLVNGLMQGHAACGLDEEKTEDFWFW